MKLRIYLFSGIILFLIMQTSLLNLYAENIPSPDKVVVLSGKEGSVPTNTGKIVAYEEKINLYAAVKAGSGWYLGYENSSLPDKIKVEEKIYSIKNGSLKRWKKDAWGKLKIKWYKIMPKMAPEIPQGGYKWYSNVFSEQEGEEGEWRGWDIIEYTQNPLPDEGWSITPAREPGTVRFRAELIYNGKKISSPGKPDPNHPSGISKDDYHRGIADTVHRISRLSDHPNHFIRYLEALRGVPWLWGADYRNPPENTPSQHQADFYNPVGFDCASLIISALRAMGNKQLEYVSAKDLIEGVYTIPVGEDRKLTLKKVTLFQNWTPRGINQGRNGKFYAFGERKIQIRDEKFYLIREIKVNSPALEILDLAVSDEGILYSLVQDGIKLKVAIIDGEGNVQDLFVPKIRKTVKLLDEEYSSEVEISPSGIEVGNQEKESERRIYLLDNDTIYIFNQKGQEKGTIQLQGTATEKRSLSGSIAYRERLFYLPTDDKKILVYNFQGELIRRIDFKDSILDADVNKEKITVLSILPLNVQTYSLEGDFIRDYTHRFLTLEGKRVWIRIGSSPDNLHVGDLFLTTSPSYHTLVLYQDNGNDLLDSQDEVICAGHEGIEIRKVSYFEGREFVLRRVAPSIKTSP